MRSIHIFTIICIFTLNNIVGQTFQFKVNNPFGLEFSENDGARKLLFYDLDGDGDLDAVITGIDSIDFSGNFTYSKITYFIAVQENIGNKKNPNFAPRKPFMTNFPFPNGYFFPAIGDLNQDGEADFIVSSGLDVAKNLQTLYYKRKSLSGDPQFDIFGPDSLELPSFVGGSLFLPELADFDKDGDLDLLMSGYQLTTDSTGAKTQKPIFMYAKNIGSTTNPKFLGWYQNPYGLENYTSTTHFITSGDIDNDNDIDLITLSIVDTFMMISVIKNSILPNGKPDFNSISLMSGVPIAGGSETYTPPTLADLDGDGDLDLFMVQNLMSSGTGIGYYENNSCVSSTANVTMSACTGQSVTIGDMVFTQSGQYQVILKTIRGCDSIVNANLTFITLNNAVTQSQNVLTAVLSGVQYQWFNCSDGSDLSGANEQSFLPTVTGSYGVRLTDSNGCKNESDCFEIIISGTYNPALSDKLLIHPNPTSDFITIINNTGFKTTRVTFINSAGHESKVITNGHIEIISTAELPSGNYIIEIIAGEHKIYKKLSVLKN